MQQSTYLQKPIVAIYDKKVGLFDPPVFVRHVGEAIREFDTLVKDPKTKYGAHPSDYEIFYIADFDEKMGIFVPRDHQHLASGV